MAAIKIDNLSKKILVVGSIYDQTDKLLHAEQLIPDYDLIIINGGLGSLQNNVALMRSQISILDRMIATKKVVYNSCHMDILLINGMLNNLPNDIIEWLALRPTAVIVKFINQNSITIINGGITNKMKMEDVLDDTEVVFVKDMFPNKTWHRDYNGRFGYIISNEPVTLEPPKFYNYSAQIGNLPFESQTEVYGQEVDQFGLKDTIIL